ncbi:MAG: hypothetical protein Unbinned338contig1000_28 [Prokaryotic dsDNA virus sp.]|nr:MAG: hypothetical protein Unbinned338contig1000_28 [Prokaryotic dsDNA virus sp.]|tara:strand:+ start:12622 stop:12786 length:165 start_codon:yes stop_codon:yes gene_type:complete
MTLFSVTGDVSGRGKINHSIKATDQIAAWDRFKAIYPKRTCKLVEIRKTLEDAK